MNRTIDIPEDFAKVWLDVFKNQNAEIIEVEDTGRGYYVKAKIKEKITHHWCPKLKHSSNQKPKS